MAHMSVAETQGNGVRAEHISTRERSQWHTKDFTDAVTAGGSRKG